MTEVIDIAKLLHCTHYYVCVDGGGEYPLWFHCLKWSFVFVDHWGALLFIDSHSQNVHVLLFILSWILNLYLRPYRQHHGTSNTNKHMHTHTIVIEVVYYIQMSVHVIPHWLEEWQMNTVTRDSIHWMRTSRWKVNHTVCTIVFLDHDKFLLVYTPLRACLNKTFRCCMIIDWIGRKMCNEHIVVFGSISKQAV